MFFFFFLCVYLLKVSLLYGQCDRLIESKENTKKTKIMKKIRKVRKFDFQNFERIRKEIKFIVRGKDEEYRNRGYTYCKRYRG